MGLNGPRSGHVAMFCIGTSYAISLKAKAVCLFCKIEHFCGGRVELPSTFAKLLLRCLKELYYSFIEKDKLKSRIRA